jgi:hypothetical protein
MAKLSPNADALANRQPRVIVTDAYLNDPIQFREDIRLTPETLLQNTSFNILERDDADFLIVTVGAENNAAQSCAVTMVSPVYNRSQIERQIQTDIEELING